MNFPKSVTNLRFRTVGGSLKGAGFRNATNFEINATIDVTYGRGVFKADGGELQLTITGKVPSVNDEYMKYELEIDGNLKRKIPTI